VLYLKVLAQRNFVAEIDSMSVLSVKQRSNVSEPPFGRLGGDICDFFSSFKAHSRLPIIIIVYCANSRLILPIPQQSTLTASYTHLRPSAQVTKLIKGCGRTYRRVIENNYAISGGLI